MTKIRTYYGENLLVLDELPDKKFSLIYIDPPFNLKKKGKNTVSKKMYRTRKDGTPSYGYKDFSGTSIDFCAWLSARIRKAIPKLTDNGSLFLHLDYNEVHNAKVFVMDQLFGPDSFINEIIWAYDFGFRPKNKWPCKHDTILWYAKNNSDYIFNYDEMDRIPYMAPGLCGPEKAARGKTPTDVWWQTVVPTSGPEKTGYATQKPLRLLDRIIKVHSNPGDWVLDFFAGSGTLGYCAAMNNRNAVLVDNNYDAIVCMRRRFESLSGVKTSWHKRV